MIYKQLTAEQQLAWNLAVSRGIAGTVSQQRGKRHGRQLSDTDRLLDSKHVPCESFVPSRAVVKPAEVEYPQASFLGAPADVRLLIYCLMEDDTKTTGTSCKDWSSKTQSEYAALRLVSRQVYHELEATEWQHWLVPQNRVNDLSSLHFFKDGVRYNKATDSLSLDSRSVVLKSFHSLSLEIPSNASPKTLNLLRIATEVLPLSELKIYFTGNDLHDNPTRSIISCCLSPENSSRKLPPSGQRFCERASFINSLAKFVNLETLVISNANLPVTYSQVVNNKPNLRRLSVIPDSRSSLTYDWDAAVQNAGNPVLQRHVHGSNIRLDVHNMPPLQELDISANAMVFSSAVVKHALPTLEKLTWIVPDPSHQAGDLRGSDLNWLQQTKSIFEHAAMHSRNIPLKTLRICFEGSIYDPALDANRNDAHEVAYLINSLLCDLQNISSLRNFELHMDYHAKFQTDGLLVAISLGKHLARFFMSEKTIIADNSTIPATRIPTQPDEFEDDLPTTDDHHSATSLPESLTPHHLLVRRVTEDNFDVCSFSTFDPKSPAFIPPAQEELAYAKKPRTDRIRRLKRLVFLAYEFTDFDGNAVRIVEASDAEPVLPADDLPEIDEDRFRLLKLNGRLLDRERNGHLFMQGYRPRAVEDVGREVALGEGRREMRRYPVAVRVVREGSKGKQAKGQGHWTCE
jgi:hypothetical protein